MLGLDPSATRAALLPRIGVMLQDGGAWSGVRADEMLRHVAALHAHPLDVDVLEERLGLARVRPHAVPTPLRRPAAAARAGDGGGRPARGGVRRRADRGHGPAGAAHHLGAAPRSSASDGVTVVLTTHYMDEAERLADRIHIIDRGRLVASGTPIELTRGGGRRRSGSSSPSRSRPVRRSRSRPRSATGHRGRAARRAAACSSPGRADASTLARVSRWCEENDVLPGVADPGHPHPRGRLPGAHRGDAGP